MTSIYVNENGSYVTWKHIQKEDAKKKKKKKKKKKNSKLCHNFCKPGGGDCINISQQWTMPTELVASK